MERWQQIEEIFHEALQRDPTQREAYLREACGRDTALRSEVDGLLAHHEPNARFEPWAAAAAAELIDSPDSLQPGQSLGPYRIDSFLAAGGMGEVYRATDTRLNREVAIKVSRDRFSERFEREARLIASLNHPNICQLYDVGPNYLVMELVDGPILADLIERGALPVNECLPIARQIAEGLEAAHEKGRIHRDLKPANIKITREGAVKLLDFGLAKAAAEPATPGDCDESRTLTTTLPGMILGTASYMSPEQAAGKPVDKRSDIWSFGVVLWEMLTGKRLFESETLSHTVADVLRAEIDFDSLPTTTPAAIRNLLGRCLDRDVKGRLRDIGEARIAIQKCLANPVISAEVNAQRVWPARISLAASFAAVVLLAACGILAFVHFRDRRTTGEVVRFQLTLPERATYTQNLAVSPDGKRVTFAALGADGVPRLWIHSFDSLDFVPLIGTEGAVLNGYQFWSWDSRFIVFQTGGFGSAAKLKKVEVSGGPPQTICNVNWDVMMGGFWTRDGQIVFGTSSSGLLQVPATGGSPSPVTIIDAATHERNHAFPVLLPDGRHFLYGIWSANAKSAGIYVSVLNGASPASRGRKLLPDETAIAFAPGPEPAASRDTGSVFFVRDSTLMMQPFHAARAELSGEPEPIAEGIAFLGAFGVSANGVLVYRSGGQDRELTWFDRQGKVLASAAPPAPYNFISLSPDDTRVAVQRLETFRAGDIWILDLARGGLGTRFTFHPGDDFAPVWSSDGKRVVWASSRDGRADIYERSTGGGREEPLVQSPLRKLPYDWSSDGRYLLYGVGDTGGNTDLWVLPLMGDRSPRALTNTEFNESQGQFSPDTRWVAYQSDESGRTEIHIQPFSYMSGGGANVMVSSGGGYQPRWRRKDGKELYYVTSDGKLVAVDVSAGTALELGKPHVLFATPIWAGGISRQVHRWDVSADGQKFLIPTSPTKTAFTVVMNWQAAFKK